VEIVTVDDAVMMSDVICDVLYFVDDELEVGHCQKEDFSCKLSRSSQVWHGMLCQLVMSCDCAVNHC